MPHHLPASRKNAFLLGREDSRVGVKMRRQSPRPRDVGINLKGLKRVRHIESRIIVSWESRLDQNQRQHPEIKRATAKIVPTSKTQPPTSSPTRTNLLPLAGVLIGVLLTYASTFTFGWVYDDPPQIPQNPNLQWSRLGFLFTHQLWASMSGSQGRFYRPFLSLWFLINKTFFGLNPHWFHVTSVLAHVAATALAFFIASRLLKDAGSALLAAAIFGLHPLQAESASWISSVNDPLAAVLCFASFLTYKKAAPRSAAPQMVGAFGLLFLSALLTKEVSVVLPGIILIDLWSTSLSSNSQDKPPSPSVRGAFRWR